MNNRLLLATVPQAAVDGLLSDAANPATNRVVIDIQDCTIRSRSHLARFRLTPRHHRLFIDGLDMVGASLSQREAIAAFEQTHWAKEPWLKAVAAATRNGLI
jgi:3-isopropylmalate/(R)-2-methylmalate dehydratase small subunit